MRWLLGTREPVSPQIRSQLENGLYGSLPIFLGGVLNSIAIAAIAAWRHPTDVFQAWLAAEIILGLLRLPVVIKGAGAVRRGAKGPATLAAVLACAWAASVGVGASLSLTSGDWALSVIVCLSAAAMVCGICLRNFGTPRLAASMVFLMLAPTAVAGLLTDEPVVAVISVQLPVFILTIFTAAFSLHRMMVSRMTALSDLQKSESFNRTILESTPDYTVILDGAGRIVFCSRPDTDPTDMPSVIGLDWLTLLPPQDRGAARDVLATVSVGLPANMITSHTDPDGDRRWFDVIAKPVSDDSGRIILVSRDITHQKNSEERALWMARHDALTRLPNRAVLQEELDAILLDSALGATCALLIVDVDNFKAINDTLGHDAGDALLYAFADRLQWALAPGDLVARTGGDEFALRIAAHCEDDIRRAANAIYAALDRPFFHDGRMLECSASIGASLVPRDGTTRSEIMKAADIALYAAKADGRRQLKIFEPAMKAEIERRESMMLAAREALKLDRMAPWFQPQIELDSGRVVGFEALLRWRDGDGAIRGPDEIKPAFDDPILGKALSERMLERTLDHMHDWLRAGLDFGTVSLNVTAREFRHAGFADRVIAALERRAIVASMLQIEVTETVFLSRDTGCVEAELRSLSRHGVHIALDDFGTGYASLSHLNQFPVDVLKIDRSFIGQLGRTADAEAISSVVINLGQSLGLDVVAEGVETREQEAMLIGLGCKTGQGFLYSGAVPAGEVPSLLRASLSQRIERAA